MMQLNKRVLDYEGQIEELERKGLMIHDRGAALITLEKISFYRLRGFYIHLYDKRKKLFLPGATWENILRIHEFDTQLRGLFMPILSAFEIALRAHLSNELAFAHGALGYLSAYHFQDPVRYHQLLASIQQQMERSDEVFVKHFIANYDGQIPIWAVTEVVSLGTLSKLFASLTDVEKKRIARSYYGYSNFKWVENWIHVITVFRNLCAHHCRLYNRAHPIKPIIIGNLLPVEKHNTLFAIILAFMFMLIGSPTWDTFIHDLACLIDSYQEDIELFRIGFPQNWMELLLDVPNLRIQKAS